MPATARVHPPAAQAGAEAMAQWCRLEKLEPALLRKAGRARHARRRAQGCPSHRVRAPTALRARAAPSRPAGGSAAPPTAAEQADEASPATRERARL
eukprot:scaffold7714_cov25-Tisochrysis_lutea.AAC.1